MMFDSLIKRFRDFKVLVVGDVMIDCYLSGKVSRISPEAPVPIIDVQKREYRLGGAANVAMNLLSLGATPILCSVVGNDEKGKIYRDLMTAQQLNSQGILSSNERKTTIKYRVVGNKAQMLRIDEEDDHNLSKELTEQFIALIQQIIQTEKINAIIFEDYDKGLLSASVIQQIVSLAKQHNIITTVDPKKRNFKHYKEVTLFKPNLKELREGMHQEGELSIEEIRVLMQQLASEQNLPIVMTTLSERGIAIYRKEDDLFYTQPAYAREISDVSGAGDTVVSVATLGLLCQLSLEQIVHLSNLSGGVVCEYAGVVPIDIEMLRNEMAKRDLSTI